MNCIFAQATVLCGRRPYGRQSPKGTAPSWSERIWNETHDLLSYTFDVHALFSMCILGTFCNIRSNTA